MAKTSDSYTHGAAPISEVMPFVNLFITPGHHGEVPNDSCDASTMRIDDVFFA